MNRIIVSAMMLAACLHGANTDQSFSFVPAGVLPMNPVMEKATLTPRSAEMIIDQTLGQEMRRSKDFYCIIHILRWKDNSTDVEKQNWYVYHNGRGWSETQFGAGRIFGSHNVALLFLHVNARGAGKAEITDAQLSASNRSRMDSLVDGVELVAKTAGFDLKSADGKNLTKLGGHVVHTDHYRVQYKAEISAKLPHMIPELANLLFPSAQADTAGVATKPVVVWGGGLMYVEPVPSDLKVTGLRFPPSSELAPAEPIELGKKTFDNEGRYWWDISAGVPLKGVKELNYDAAAQSIAPKEVTRQSLLAFLNILPMKLDTKADRQGIVPVLLVGMGISEKAFDRIVFAGGIGINKVQFFAGTAYTNKQFPGATPGSVVTNRRTNFIYGMNIPLRQAVQFLKKSK